MARKICKKCGLEKDVGEFPSRFYASRGREYVSNHCKACEKERSRLKALRRTKKQRQAERRRVSEQQGKRYRTFEEIQKDKAKAKEQ